MQMIERMLRSTSNSRVDAGSVDNMVTWRRIAGMETAVVAMVEDSKGDFKDVVMADLVTITIVEGSSKMETMDSMEMETDSKASVMRVESGDTKRPIAMVETRIEIERTLLSMEK